MINLQQFQRNFKLFSQSGGLPMQMNTSLSSLPQVHQRKTNICNMIRKY